MFFYIDPGTGSMLFTILIGVFGAAIYSIKLFFVKLRSLIGGKKVEASNKKIPIVIYSDDKRYWSVFEPICDELDKLDIEVLYLAASEDDKVFKREYKNIRAEFIGKGNSSWFRLNYLNAHIVFSTTPGLDVYQWKRSKKVDYYVHITHSAGCITMYRMYGIDYYDSLLLSGERQVQDVRKLERLRKLPEKELVKVGIPYMDVMAKRLQDAEPIGEHPRTVLLAPSWGKSAIFSVYGGKILEELLKTGYKVIVRPHPQSFTSEKDLMEKLMQEFPESEQLEWNKDTDNFEVLRHSDILISDFSGVIYDFTMIHGKPVIYTEPKFDLGPYDAWWLKEPTWTMEVLPKLGCQLNTESFADIKGLIDYCLEDEKFANGIMEAKQEAWENFGQGAELTAKYLANKLEEIKLKKEQEKLEKPISKKKEKKKKAKEET